MSVGILTLRITLIFITTRPDVYMFLGWRWIFFFFKLTFAAHCCLERETRACSIPSSVGSSTSTCPRGWGGDPSPLQEAMTNGSHSVHTDSCAAQLCHSYTDFALQEPLHIWLPHHSGRESVMKMSMPHFNVFRMMEGRGCWWCSHQPSDSLI